MNLREQLHLSDEHYGLLFGVRRSIRYHDRRRAFYEQLHHVTSLLTILMAGSVLFDVAKKGETDGWLTAVSVAAALLAALDMVVGYSKRANLHGSLRERFVNLEIEILKGAADDAAWVGYQTQRLLIEKDEPPIYKVLDCLCHNELLEAEGVKDPQYFFNAHFWQRWTSQLLRWENVKTV